MSIALKPGQFARTLESADAQELADITGLRRDFRLVQEACAVIESRKGSPSAEHIRRACFDSAVMRYRRCFNGGVRDLFPKELLKKLTPQQKILHERVLGLANQSVAHCVDGSEDNLTYFVYDKNTSPASVSIEVYTRTTSHHNKVNIKKLSKLARKLEGLLAKRGERIAKRVIRSVRKMSASEVSALPPVQSNITDDGEQLKPKYRKNKKAKAGSL